MRHKLRDDIHGQLLFHSVLELHHSINNTDNYPYFTELINDEFSRMLKKAYVASFEVIPQRLQKTVKDLSQDRPEVPSTKQRYCHKNRE
jgi:IS1 family transposase